MSTVAEELGFARPLALLFGLYFISGSIPLDVSTAPAMLVALAALLYAAQPSLFDELSSSFNPGRDRHGMALLVLLFGLWAVVLRPLSTLIQIFWMGGVPSLDITVDDLTFSLVSNLLVMVGTPLVWTHLVNGGSPLDALGFRLARPVRDSVMGLSVALLSLAAVAGVNYLLVAHLGLDPENPLAGRIVDLVDLRMAFFVAAAAAIGEETFFRGFLQPKVGIVPAAVLFSVGHSSYGVASQLIGPFVFGLLLGWLYRETESLLAPILSHFAFNFTVLFVALTYGVRP